MVTTNPADGRVDAGKRIAAELARYPSGRAGRQQFLRDRWAELEQERPLDLMPERFLFDNSGEPLKETETTEDIPVSAIVAIDDDCTWGQLNNRMNVFDEMVKAVADAGRTGAWEQWAEVWGYKPIDTRATRGGQLEVYSIIADGRHRAMMAAALRLPTLPANVTRSAPLTPGTVVWLREPEVFDPSHYDNLVAAGELRSWEFNDRLVQCTIATGHDIDWWFDDPASVATAASLFRVAHPEAPLPADMSDAASWAARFAPPRQANGWVGRLTERFRR